MRNQFISENSSMVGFLFFINKFGILANFLISSNYITVMLFINHIKNQDLYLLETLFGNLVLQYNIPGYLENEEN